MSKKWVLCTAGGAAVSLGLGITMMQLIAGDFTPQEKHDTTGFEVKVEVVEPPLLIRNPAPQIADEVQTPPPPPVLERQSVALPSEPIADPVMELPTFKKYTPDPNDLIIRVSDVDAQPLVRIRPVMPPHAETSGHCKVRFDVSASGDPYNIAATYCSQSVFSRPSVKSVEQWKYKPKIQNGRAVELSGVMSTIRFKLLDDRGQVIPE